MSGCKASVTPPNGWGDVPCGGEVVARDLCELHLTQARDDRLLRQRITTMCLADRLIGYSEMY